MLSHEENVRLTSTEEGTPMGRMLRRYWLPACMSSEVSMPGGRPLAVRLLGQRCVVFRDSEGEVGVMDEGCPHRGASLALARNEDCALTCLYHGWRIARDGRILEMASEPEESSFGDRLTHAAYPTVEAGGLIWTYLGPPEHEPPPPDFGWMHVPEGHRAIGKVIEDANWVQALEGAIDSAHSSTLHQDYIRPSATVAKSSMVAPESNGDPRVPLVGERPSADTRPTLRAESTPYGMHYAALRRPFDDPEQNVYARVTCWVAPWTCLIPPTDKYRPAHVFVPASDTETAFYAIQWNPDEPVDEAAWLNRLGAVPGEDVDERFRKLRHLGNGYRQDREAMEAGESFTGIVGISTQDQAMQETMGPVVDRTKEHLGASDVAIIRFRRGLLASLDRFEQGGPPVGLDDEGLEAGRRAASAEAIIPKSTPWSSLAAGDVAGTAT